MELLSKKERILRGIVAVIMMFIGCAAILVLILAMNSITPKKENPKNEYKEMISHKRKPPPKKKKREKPKRTRPKREISKAAPAPNISTAISGLSFNIPGLEGVGMDEAVDQVLGEKAAENVVMTADTVDVIPKPLHEGRLEYPARARQKNQEGFVVINMLIDAKGNVQTVKVLEAHPIGVFEEATLSWARSLKFTPAYYKGKPVRTWARRRIPFKLSG
jgi:periplasmic protein TonB